MLNKLEQFSFNHTEQIDRLYEIMTGQGIKEAFDSRGEELRISFNSLIDNLQSVIDSYSGADNIGITPISALGKKEDTTDYKTVQEVIEKLIIILKSTLDNSSGADFISATNILGLTGNTIQGLLESLKEYVDTYNTTHKKSTSTDHDNRYYSKDEIKSIIDGSSGADNVGVTSIPTLSGNTVQEVLENTQARFDDIAKTNVNVEVSNTHFGKDGKTYETLPKRLDAIDSSLADMAINVMQFGAKGDGITDDTQAIQNAINYCISNNLNLIFAPYKIYCISQKVTITKLEGNINFNFAEIKAISSMDVMIEINTVEMPLLQNKIRCITNLNLNGNSKSNTLLLINQEHNLSLNNLRLKGFLVSGIKTNQNNYELMFDNILIQGTGGIGLDINSSDSHYSNVIIFDCNTAIISNGFNFYSKIHAWIYDTNLVEGSIFAKCTKSSFFNNCYSDTYQKAFYVIGNYNISISQCHLFCKETVFNSTTSSSAPYFIYVDDEVATSGIVINCNVGKPLMTAINGSFGYFCNKTSYKGQYGQNKFEKYSNIPIGINSQLAINNGFNTTYNRLRKKDGRVLCEAKICKSDGSNFGSGNFTLATFPAGFIPKFDKTLLAFCGYEWGLIMPVYVYINGSSGLQVTLPTMTTYPTHIHLSFEYDTDVYTDNILYT